MLAQGHNISVCLQFYENPAHWDKPQLTELCKRQSAPCEVGNKSLGLHAKLRKATITFVTSPRLLSAMNSAPAGREFMKSDILVFFENLWTEVQFQYKLTIKTATSHEDQNTFLITSRSVLLGTINVSDKICTENQNTPFYDQ